MQRAGVAGGQGGDTVVGEDGRVATLSSLSLWNTSHALALGLVLLLFC